MNSGIVECCYFQRLESKLADEEDIQGDVKGLGHLKPYRDATSRQGEHNYIIAIGILAKFLGEQAARFGSISKWK